MLPGGLDAAYRNALSLSHRPYFKIEILDGFGNVLIDDPEYISGQVSASLNSRVTREATCALAETYYPYQPTDPLAPYGNMLRVTRGIDFATGPQYRWIIFIGRIQEATLNTDGTCVIRASDLCADVIENLFVVPDSSQVGSDVAAEVRRLITDALPTATFGTFDTFGIPVQALAWQLDRGQALDELSQSVGAFWYALADGSFVLRRYAWTIPGLPVVTYSDDDDGSISDSSASRSREDVYNSLTVTGERLNGDDPVYATAFDDNPASPTFVLGPFGRRHQLLRLQTPASQGSAVGAAKDNLKRLTALVDTWSWDMTPDAALELGDIVSLNVRGRSDIIQVVSGFTIPFDLSRPMTVDARSQVIGQLQGVE